MEASEYWSTGDYRVVGDLWGQVGRDLAATLFVAGLDVVDPATGTGVTAISLAEHGAASTVGVDVTPVLLEEAERRAISSGVDVHWVEADVMSVPLPAASADLVTSTFGLIFATDPSAAFREAQRLTRPGGRVVFTSWSPHGLFGQIRRVLASYFPDEPEPWHETREGIRGIAGSDAEVTEQSFELRVDSPESFIEMMERWSAPIVLATQSLGEGWSPARAELVAAVTEAGHAKGGTHRVQVPYLVATVTVPDSVEVCESRERPTHRGRSTP